MIVAIGQRREDPGTGSAGDLSAPALPSPPGPSRVEQLLDLAQAHPQLTVLAACVLLAVVAIPFVTLAICVLARRGRRLSTAVVRHDDDDQADDKRVIKKSLRRAVNAAFGLFVFSSATSMVGTIYALAPLIGDDLGLWAFVIALAGGLEAAMIVFFNLARVRILEDGKAGVEGFAPWAFAAVIGSVNFYEVLVGSNHWGWATARTTLPFGTAFIISRILAYYRRRWLKARKSQQADAQNYAGDTPNPLRTLWTKALTWLGLDGGQNIADSSLVYRRRIIRLAKLEFKLANLPDDTSNLDPKLARRVEARRQRWKARSMRQLARLLARYGAQATADISRYLAIFHQAKVQLSEDVVNTHRVWEAVVGSGSASGSGSAGSAPTGSAGSDSPSGSGTATVTGSGSGDAPATGGAGAGSPTGSGSDEPTGSDNPGGSGSATGGTSRGGSRTPKMSWDEIREARKSWSSADYAARRADAAVAQEFATRCAEQVLADGKDATKAMRAYFVAMVAAGWTKDTSGFSANDMHMAAYDGAPDTRGWGRNKAREWTKQLGPAPEEIDAELQKIIAAGGGDSTATGGAK